MAKVETAEFDLAPNVFVSERDKQILLIGDENYKRMTWDEAKKIIASNELEKLTRLPSQLKAYLHWSQEIKIEYGSMTNYLLKERLHWQPLPNTDPVTFAVKDPVPFADPTDYKVLRNDWPYGFEFGIVHICVWLKGRLPVATETGDLTPNARAAVKEFVRKTFTAKLGLEGKDQVLWFKNWVALQSVRGLEHFHVLLRDVGDEDLAMVLDHGELTTLN